MNTIRSFLFLLLITILFNSINSIRIEGKVEVEEPTSERLKKITVSLIWGDQISYITNSGHFFFNVNTPGYYLVEVNDDLYQYQTMFLDVKEDEIKSYEYNYRYGKGTKHKYPFTIKSVNKIQIGETKASILSSILKSPYAIMIGLGLLFFACMKMVPEEELRAQQEELRKNGFKSFFNQK